MATPDPAACSVKSVSRRRNCGEWVESGHWGLADAPRGVSLGEPPTELESQGEVRGRGGGWGGGTASFNEGARGRAGASLAARADAPPCVDAVRRVVLAWLRAGWGLAWLRAGWGPAWLRAGWGLAWLRAGWLRAGWGLAWLRAGWGLAWLRAG